MTRPLIKALVSDIAAQPKWRKSGADNGYSAQKAADYYDGIQITSSQRNKMRELGMPDLVENLIKRPVNSMLGHEAQSRRDWLIKAKDESSEEVAEGLNQKLNDELNEGEVNNVCSEAYSSQIKKGIGWVHVRRNDDFLRAAKYRFEHVHLDEMFWDMRSRQLDLDDCRWMARRRYLDNDECKAFLPKQFHQLVDMVGAGWVDPSQWEIVEGQMDVDSRMGEWSGAGSSLDAYMDSQRKRVALYEVYYRAFESAVFLLMKDGTVVEFDDKDQRHMVYIMSGQAEIKKHVVKRMRRCWYLGPHFLIDEESPYPHDLFPYVPFFGYREDGLNIPYGIIRDMMDSQDGFNNCNMRIHHLMNQVRIIKDDDATPDMTDDDVVHEANRKDSVINKKRGSELKIERHTQEIRELTMQRAEHKAMIQEVSGVMDAYTGKGSLSQSGVALQSLAELTAVTLAEINDNYEYGRKKVAELALSYIVHDIGEDETVINIPEDIHQVKHQVVLNGRDDRGMSNLVSQAKFRVDLQPIQASKGYKMQVHGRQVEMLGMLPDAMKMEFFPMVVESSDWPKRKEFLAKWNKKNGIINDPEKLAEAEQQQAAAGAEEKKVVDEMRMAEIRLKIAQARERESEASLRDAQAAKVISEVEQIREDSRVQERNAKDELLAQARIAMGA